MLGLSRSGRGDSSRIGGSGLPSNREDDGQGSRWGQACAQPWVLWEPSSEPEWEGAQAGLLDSSLLSCTRTRSGCGLLWPQSRTGAQRAPNPGGMKLAAGKRELHPSIPPLWALFPACVGPPTLELCLGTGWSTCRLPPPTGREAAPETSHEVGQGRQRVNGSVARVHWTGVACLGS